MLRKPLIVLLTMLALATFCVGQAAPTPLTQGWTETISLAPPTVLNSQSFSTSSATGVLLSSSGGTVAAGTYRICVTFFTSTNTETPCSTDTATTSTVTTTGSTSTVTVYPPISVGGGGNIVGYRVYIGANGGATAAETLQTLNSTVCTLSSSSTPSCALTSPAIFTSSANFSAGGGGPASPGTAIFPPVTNAANTSLFENSIMTYRTVYWTVSGTAPSACTFNVQTGATIGGLANVGQTITCTASGSYVLPLTTTAAFSALNIATYTAGDTTTKVSFYFTTSPYGPPVGFVNAVPSGNCTNGFTMVNTAAASASTVVYVCQPANTFTAITVP